MNSNKISQQVRQRVGAPTRPFFQKLRNAGLALAAVSGTLLASPMALPPGLTQVAGYLALAGGVIGAVSQLTVHSEEQES